MKGALLVALATIALELLTLAWIRWREADHGMSSSFPVVRRAARSSWALAASASGYVPPIRTVSRPAPIQLNRSFARNIRQKRAS
jgi:hypothetical protein